MKRRTSLKSSILITVCVSLSCLAGFLIFGITRNEISKSQETTRQLVLEQISLIVKKLDNYSVLGQVDAISKNIFELERVEAFAMFDSGCQLIRKQPINFDFYWNCKSPILRPDLLLYNVTNSFSATEGAPRFILAKVRTDRYDPLAIGNLTPLAVTALSIFATILLLNSLFRRKVLEPLEQLKNIVASAGSLTDPLQGKTLPAELEPIYESVFKRDEVIQQAKRELVSQEKAQVIAEMSQQVAHDIKFPIMILRDRIYSSSAGTSNQKYYEEALADLEGITGQLLENSHAFLKDVDLNSIVASVIENKRIEFANDSDRLEFAFVKKHDSMKVRANPIKLKSVLSNLINNSKEAIGYRAQGRIEITASSSDGIAILSISDNGCGIRESELQSIFERGVSIRKPGGSGLGLTNAREVVQSLNGELKLDSEFGSGTTVELRLPLVESSYQFNGDAPFNYVLIEDHKLSQLLWLEEAKEKALNFAVFSSPNEFVKNEALVSKEAHIYIDSHFPDFNGCGAEWSQLLWHKGFSNLWLCSTNEIETKDKPWIAGAVKKTQPFGVQIASRLQT